MLSALDEGLLHQSALPFAQTVVSDHRFFDRVWFVGVGQAGVRFLCGLAVYKNTNTVDGYFTVLQGRAQRNLRVSRPLLPDPAAMAAGPISIEVVEPLRTVRLRIAPSADHPFDADLLFNATVPPHHEKQHFKRVDGRILQDYTRYDQVGRFAGRLSIDGEAIDVQDWFGARDHSWGVRQGVGGFEPSTAIASSSLGAEYLGVEEAGFLLVSVMFDSPHWAGHFQQQEDGAGRRLYLDGTCVARHEDGTVGVSDPVVALEHELVFIEGTRSCTGGRVTVVLKSGARLAFEVSAFQPHWCMKGTGYDSGYDDERGLGVHRGQLIESDQYDLSLPEDVKLPDGRLVRPWHRETDAILSVNGDRGFAHFAVISSGSVERYGLYQPISNRRT